MPLLEEEISDGVLFQQDGASPRIYQEVTDFLKRKFLEKWLGRGGPVTSPPGLPDVTSLILLLGFHQRCCVRGTIAYHFAGTYWEVDRISYSKKFVIPLLFS